jgi:rod shape determining protein RodA
MILYIILLFICYRVAFNSLHDFGKLATVGGATMIFSHIFINMGMISGILPVVGTPMPFLSYGGSNIATNLIGIGLVLSIDRSRKQGFIKLR